MRVSEGSLFHKVTRRPGSCCSYFAISQVSESSASGVGENVEREPEWRTLGSSEGQDLEVVHILTLTFYWPELSHMATPNGKGGWEMSFSAIWRKGKWSLANSWQGFATPTSACGARQAAYRSSTSRMKIDSEGAGALVLETTCLSEEHGRDGLRLAIAARLKRT